VEEHDPQTDLTNSYTTHTFRVYIRRERDGALHTLCGATVAGEKNDLFFAIITGTREAIHVLLLWCQRPRIWTENKGQEIKEAKTRFLTCSAFFSRKANVVVSVVGGVIELQRIIGSSSASFMSGHPGTRDERKNILGSKVVYAHTESGLPLRARFAGLLSLGHWMGVTPSSRKLRSPRSGPAGRAALRVRRAKAIEKTQSWRKLVMGTRGGLKMGDFFSALADKRTLQRQTNPNQLVVGFFEFASKKKPPRRKHEKPFFLFPLPALHSISPHLDLVRNACVLSPRLGVLWQSRANIIGQNENVCVWGLPLLQVP
jgi:hypothetical protein